jgi:uncharacterized protein with PIN domain
VILDTSAVIAILRLEPEAAEFAAIIERAPHRRMSAVSYVEAGAVIDGSKDPVASRRLDDSSRKQRLRSSRSRKRTPASLVRHIVTSANPAATPPN